MANFVSIDLDNLMAAIAQRRSLGLARLKPDPIDPAIVEKMLEAANWAPSNEDTEPWRFTVFAGEGRAKLADAFGEAYRGDLGDGEFNETAYEGYRNRAYQAPLWISIGMTPKLEADGSYVTSEDEEIMAAACAAQNLHLVAAAHGLIGMWHSKGTSTHPKVAEALGLSAPSRLLGLFFFGWPNVEWPAGERGPVSEKVTWA